jgi:protein ImuA
MQTQKEKIESLRREILDLQGLGSRPCGERPPVSLGPVLDSMPGRVFPTGAVHEFLSPTPMAAAATSGFISAIAGVLAQSRKPCIWVSMHRTLFPPGVKGFGLDPDQIIFIDAARDKEALWAAEEALKCEAIGTVIAEIRELDFTQSRRLQLAVETSRATGFIHRIHPRGIRPTACVSRWQILPAASQTSDGLPGVGFARWQVELLKIRNGRPGRWQVEWNENAFHVIHEHVRKITSPVLKTGAA